jgi:hypothetical protein
VPRIDSPVSQPGRLRSAAVKPPTDRLRRVTAKPTAIVATKYPARTTMSSVVT